MRIGLRRDRLHGGRSLARGVVLRRAGLPCRGEDCPDREPEIRRARVLEDDDRVSGKDLEELRHLAVARGDDGGNAGVQRVEPPDEIVRGGAQTDDQRWPPLQRISNGRLLRARDLHPGAGPQGAAHLVHKSLVGRDQDDCTPTLGRRGRLALRRAERFRGRADLIERDEETLERPFVPGCGLHSGSLEARQHPLHPAAQEIGEWRGGTRGDVRSHRYQTISDSENPPGAPGAETTGGPLWKRPMDFRRPSRGGDPLPGGVPSPVTSIESPGPWRRRLTATSARGRVWTRPAPSRWSPPP